MSVSVEPKVTLVVLGGGFKSPEARSFLAPERQDLGLSLHSKERVLAAVQRVQRGDVIEVIFTGGRTAGEDWPPEAEGMQAYAVRHSTGDIRERFKKAQIEGLSKDTAANAENIAVRLEQAERVEVLSNRLHSIRGARLLRMQGIPAKPIHAEPLLMERFGNRYGFLNADTGRALAVEVAANMLLVVDPNLSLLKGITARRGQSASTSR
jgi:uncharacterized SAM-binding protein YcdF (DUF218 family)